MIYYCYILKVWVDFFVFDFVFVIVVLIFSGFDFWGIMGMFSVVIGFRFGFLFDVIVVMDWMLLVVRLKYSVCDMKDFRSMFVKIIKFL